MAKRKKSNKSKQHHQQQPYNYPLKGVGLHIHLFQGHHVLLEKNTLLERVPFMINLKGNFTSFIIAFK